MNPVAFEIFGLQVRWYGVLITFGVILGTYIAGKNADSLDLKKDCISDYLIWAIPAAVIGARAYYVLFNLDYYAGDFFRIINIRAGGLAVHGGFMAAVLVAAIFCKKNGIQIFDFLDVIMTAVPLGQAIGRWGNFINGEAHGGPTDLPWAIVVDGQRVHPTFLYESIWDFALFILLNVMFHKRKFSGEIFAAYLMGYSAGRFWIEALRTDSLYFGSFRAAQLVSVIMIIIGVAVWFYGEKRRI